MGRAYARSSDFYNIIEAPGALATDFVLFRRSLDLISLIEHPGLARNQAWIKETSDQGWARKVKYSPGTVQL
jgi:hypothetical protein